MRKLWLLLLLPVFVISVQAAESSVYIVSQDVWPPDQPLGLSADIETYALEPITPSDATGLKAVLLSVLGNYESIVTDYRYQNASGNWQYLREIQPDYVWLASAGVFGLLLWCTFRMAGGIFCRR